MNMDFDSVGLLILIQFSFIISMPSSTVAGCALLQLVAILIHLWEESWVEKCEEVGWGEK